MAVNKATNTKIKEYPNNYEAERSVLCCLLIDGQKCNEFASQLDENSFFNQKHKKIFNAIKQVISEGKAVNFVSVCDKLINSGNRDLTDILSEISNLLTSAAACKEYVEIVKRDELFRQIIDTSNSIIEKVYDGDANSLEYAQKEIFNLTKTRGDSSLITMQDANNQLLSRLQKLRTDKNAFIGLMTGFNRLDKLTNGFQKGDLIILAARPSVGKSAFALNIVANNIINKKLIVYYSLEMPAIQISQRILANLSSVSLNEIKTGDFIGDNRLDALWSKINTCTDSNFYINDSSLMNPGKVVNECRQLSIKLNRPIDLIIVDYIGLMSDGDDSSSSKYINSRQELIASYSKSMKIAARELNCPVLALSQMSRSIEQREDKNPQLSDLRESGSIEQDADIVMFLSREDDEDHDGPLILAIEKHRNGELKKIRLNFDGSIQKFTESVDQNNVEVKSKGKKKSKKPDELQQPSNQSQQLLEGEDTSITY